MNTSNISALVFVSLNMADAWLTHWLVSTGYGIEGNMSILAQKIGSDILIRAMLALLIVLLLYYWKRLKLLLLINIGLGLVVLWNLGILVFAKLS